MKKRNLVIVAFLLVAAMTLGVGYAALTANLTIGGKAYLLSAAVQDQITDEVYIADGVEEYDGGSYQHDGVGSVENAVRSATDTAFGPDCSDVRFAVRTLKSVGEYVTFKYTIKNDTGEDVTADVKLIGDTDVTNNYFKASIAWDSKSGTGGGTVAGDTTGTKTIAADSTQDVYVTVTLTKVFADNLTSTIEESFDFTIEATVPGTVTP